MIPGLITYASESGRMSWTVRWVQEHPEWMEKCLEQIWLEEQKQPEKQPEKWLEQGFP
jgi:hypothetical protein